MSKKPILLIPSSNTKKGGTSRADTQYTGNLYEGALFLARRSGVKCRILSPKHGVLKITWAKKVVEQLDGYTDLHSVCGSKYESPLLQAGLRMTIYLYGMGAGVRVREMKTAKTIEELSNKVDKKAVESLISIVPKNLLDEEIVHHIMKRNKDLNLVEVASIAMGLSPSQIRRDISSL